MAGKVKEWLQGIPPNIWVLISFFMVLVLLFAFGGAPSNSGSVGDSKPRRPLPSMVTPTHPQKAPRSTPMRLCEPVTVRHDDTISKIASEVGVTPDYLMRRNHIREAWKIMPGDRLCTTGKILPEGWPIKGDFHFNPPPVAPDEPKVDKTKALLLQPPHGQLQVPVTPYVISQQYVGQYPYHNGIDFAGPYGSTVRSVANGRVIGVWWWTYSYGYHVLIQHVGGQTQYAHLANIYVKKGQIVKMGQIIGIRDNTGHSTGDHLHFEIWKHGRTVNPAPYFWRYGIGSCSPKKEVSWTGHD